MSPELTQERQESAQAPAVSVLMPVYNAERYVAEATESILNQTFRDFEFIIIDDGSTDGSLEILRRYEAQDARIRLFTQENRGLVATLNEGMELARAPLIARMDADDLSLPERFEKQVAFLAAHPEVVACGGAVEKIDDEGRFLTVLRLPTEDEAIQEGWLNLRPTTSHPAMTMRTEAVRAVKGYQSEFLHAEDADLWLKLGELGKLANLPEPVIQHRMHPGSVSWTHQETQWRNMRRICEEARARRGLPYVSFEGRIGSLPTPESSTQAEHYSRCGWWAYGSGEWQTAILYGFCYLRRAPLAKNSYVLLLKSTWHLLCAKPTRRAGQ